MLLLVSEGKLQYTVGLGGQVDLLRGLRGRGLGMLGVEGDVLLPGACA